MLSRVAAGDVAAVDAAGEAARRAAVEDRALLVHPLAAVRRVPRILRAALLVGAPVPEASYVESL